jgi:ubiquinone/menaquinone biosynthesis C-methylase UbiE
MKNVNIDNYAGSSEKSPYDVLAAHNREYQRLLKAYPRIVEKYAGRSTDVADFACGTGNFSLAIYDALKDNNGLKIDASDISESMLGIFNAKIARKGLNEIISTSIKDITMKDCYERESFDLINITHALNYTGKPKQVMDNINYWLKPNGIMIAADIGRKLVVPNWSRGMFKWVYNDMARAGFGPLAIIPTLSLFARYSAAKKENENFREGQQSGEYPMHSSEEFKKWTENAGFEILHFSNDFYRDPVTNSGIDDLVVAMKK